MWVSGHPVPTLCVQSEKLNIYRLSASSNAARIPPSRQGNMSRVVVHIELEFRQVLARDTDVSVGDHQDMMVIDRRPRADSCDSMSRQPVHW